MRTVAVRVVRSGGADEHYRAQVSAAFAARHDNGALVSIGWTVREDGGGDLPPRALAWLRARGRLTPITHEQWNHSGCQSACVLRGASECR